MDDTVLIIVVNVAATIAFLSGLIRNWLLAKGTLEPVYWLMILMGLANFVVNCAVLIMQPAMWGLISYQFLTLWSICMGIKGLIRLRSLR